MTSDMNGRVQFGRIGKIIQRLWKLMVVFYGIGNTTGEGWIAEVRGELGLCSPGSRR